MLKILESMIYIIIFRKWRYARSKERKERLQKRAASVPSFSPGGLLKTDNQLVQKTKYIAIEIEKIYKKEFQMISTCNDNYQNRKEMLMSRNYTSCFLESFK